VVPLDAGFVLTSGDGTPARDLAGRVTVTPPLAFAITDDAEPGRALLRPTEPLVPGVVYRFDLADAQGDPLDSWAFQATQGLRVVSTLPGDRSNDVPIDTGIEIHFDQDGVSGASSHVAITPAVKGRFEMHGRALVFVPDKPLKRRTLYTVTVSPGVEVAGTGQQLESAVRFRFETAARSSDEREVTSFTRDLIDVATADRPLLGVDYYESGRLPVQVFRLAGLDAAIDAYQRVATRPRWTQWQDTDIVSTKGLPRVFSGGLRSIRLTNDARAVRLPVVLPAGWYLAQTGTRDHGQAILQVTDVAGYAAASVTRTVAWVNDLHNEGALRGAEVALADGTSLGATDASGLLTADTPSAAASGDTIVTIRAADGRRAFVPLTLGRTGFPWEDPLYNGSCCDTGYDLSCCDRTDPDAYWQVLDTDRSLYRRTDTINIWGDVVERISGGIPDEITLRVVPALSWYDLDSSSAAAGAIATQHVAPRSSGVFSASLPIVDAPEGYYDIELAVGDATLVRQSISIGPIVKPAYRLSVTTGHHVYIAGDLVRATVEARFYDGTPVPGLGLTVTGLGNDQAVITDATGVGSFRRTAHANGDDLWNELSAYPARSEEAEIGGSREYYVFPSSRMLEGAATIADGHVQLTGSMNLVDVDRLNRELETHSIWELEPKGAPVAGATLKARTYEIIPTRHQTGTAYDFIAKKVVPIYEYDTRSRLVTTSTLKTDGQGGFELSVPTGGSRRDFEVTLETLDPAGLRARTTVEAYATHDVPPDRSVGLVETGPAGAHEDGYGIGDQVDLTVVDDGGRAVDGGADRYLFLTAQHGIRSATTLASPRFVMPFETASAPNLTILATRFTGTGYMVIEPYTARFRTSDRALKIELRPDRDRYQPGESVSLAVRTLDHGRPIAATVVLRAVDAKLYDIDAARDSDPLEGLYRYVDDGLLAAYASHQGPASQGGGDTGGGGGDDFPPRTDFRDSVLFQTIDTDAEGNGQVTFKLSDDLTSWRVSASAFTRDLQAGEATVDVPVGLPLFVEATIAPRYLLTDRPTIHVRVYGSSLDTSTPVTITVASDSLGLAKRTIEATAFDDVRVALPNLKLGTQRVTIGASATADGSKLSDALARTFDVVRSRLTRPRSTSAALVDGVIAAGGSERTTLTFTDAGRARYAAFLLDAANDDGPRLDRLAAADVASAILREIDPTNPALPPSGQLVAERYQEESGALALLPYASSDLQTSVLVALMAPDSVERASLSAYLAGVRGNSRVTRERQNFALAGLAGLQAGVLPALRTAAADDKATIRERLFLGMGAAAIGDLATARALADALIARWGEDLGGMRRLRVGESDADSTAATARLAVVLAQLGDPRAPDYWAYVESDPSAEDPLVLEQVAFAAAMLRHVPAAPASFAYTLGGKRSVVDLARGQSFRLEVSRAQREALSLEPLAGAVGVTSVWREAARVSDFRDDPDVSITRTVRPSPASSSQLVRVDLRVTFGSRATKGCYVVTDLVPSGLAPVSELRARNLEDEEFIPSYETPFDQSGGRVSFCAEKRKDGRPIQMRYYARPITTGTYTWEPAIAQRSSASDRATLTGASKIVLH